MRYYYDLHLHTCLSPCGDDDMTPNNIVNMAMLKGLDIIAISDHNTIGNYRAVMEVARNSGGLLVVPAMELCTAEEIHLLCYFPDFYQANLFQKELSGYLPPIKNKEEIFGRQIYCDAADEITGIEESFLAGASSLDADSAIRMVRAMGGAVVPAHVDRESFSMLNTLGSIPAEYELTYLEYSKRCHPEAFIREHQALAAYPYLQSSDAHFLWDIMERENAIELEEKSTSCLIEKINAGY